jgi:hypothetical protein
MPLALRDARAPMNEKGSTHLDLTRGRSRPLLLMERTMYRDGHTPFASVFPIKLTGHLDECLLRDALLRLQHKHPLLRCVVNDSPDRPRFVLRDNPAPIPLRIVDRLSEDEWEDEVLREWTTPFNGAAGALIRLVWLRGSGIHNLILAGHHCICDGQGGIGLLQDLLRAYKDPQCDIGSYTELGSLEDIVPPPLLLDHKFHRRLRWKRRSLECILWLNARRRKNSEHIDAKTIYFRRRVLSAHIAQSIADRSKIEKVTVLAPAALAFMQAFRDVRGAKSFKKVNAMVDARRLVHRIPTNALFGLSPGVPMRVKDLPFPSDVGLNTFWTRARALKADLDKRVGKLASEFYRLLLSLEGLHHRYSRVVDFFESTPAIRSLTFSNVGRLTLGTQYRDLCLEKVYSPLVMVSPTPANTVVLSSFGGEMEFAIISDEQSMPRADAVAILRRTTEILEACVVESA